MFFYGHTAVGLSLWFPWTNEQNAGLNFTGKDLIMNSLTRTNRAGSANRSLRLQISGSVLLLVACTVATGSAQTLLQRCIGVVPGQEPKHPLGPTPQTVGWCQRLPGWNLYQMAGQRYQARDHAGAARLAVEAAQAGNAIAQERVALMYAQGDGVRANHPMAVKWLRAAVALNEPLAEDLLGTVYEFGQSEGRADYGVADNWDIAARLWKASASQGWINGEYSLGRAYQYGIGVPLSLQSAIYWYDKAAAQGHAQAAYFAKYLRDNHGFDGSSRDDYERSQLGPLMGRTMPFIPPTGTIFHHLSQRLAYVRKEYVEQETAKARANWDMQDRRYKECRQNGGDNCHPPMGARPN